jgi:predicted nucleic acid-binding protein
MYLLDSNAISEMRKAALGRADLGVQSWADSVDWRELYLSAITIMEMDWLPAESS